jgi:hypothetical protein
VQTALSLLSLGQSKKSIAKQLGISTHAVLAWSRRDHDELVAARTGAGAHERAACALIQTVPPRHYAYLLGQYLGDGSIATHRRAVYRLVIACCDLYPDIIERCTAAMMAVLPNSVSYKSGRGCVSVSSYSKHWPCLFPQHGAGKKHGRPIRLVAWQAKIVAGHTEPFLRGLFESDGCRIINRVRHTRHGVTKTYEYPRYFFSNESQDILQICGDALDLINVEWRFNRPNSISVARRASVAKLDEFIGPKS